MITHRQICAIDIGSSKIISVLAKVNRKARLDSFHIEEAASSGIDNGRVSDVSALADSIQNVIQALKNKTKATINQAVININGNNISCRHSKATVPIVERGSKIISARDIDKVKRQARLLGLNLEEQVVHEFAQNYSIDNYGEVKNPLGLYGRKISVDLYLIISKTNYIDNILEALNQAGIEVRSLVFSGLASSLAVLNNEEMEKGCILIDIGADLTELLVFKDGSLKLIENLPIGGNRITQSIASKLNISFELAEELKKSYAIAIKDEVKEDEEILVKKVSTYSPIKKRLIADACQQPINKLITMIKEKIDKIPFKDQIAGGVIITGGGSLLHGLLELIELKIGMPTRLGKVRNISLVSSKNPQYSCAIGLVYYFINNYLAKRSLLKQGSNFLGLLSERLKYLYQEYF
ncbi:MAG: cell division protein FtsA [Candidatus Omnitrophota bacterium]